MFSNTLKSAVMAAALMSAPALAQTTTPPAQPSTPPMSAPSTTPAPAPVTPPPAATANTEQKAGQWQMSKIIGLNVYNAANEKVGDISEALFTQDGRIEAVVIGVGGFLGMGKHDVAIPFGEIKWMSKPATTQTSTAPTGTDRTATTGSITQSAPSSTPATGAEPYPDHAVISMTADELKAAPAFKYAR